MTEPEHVAPYQVRLDLSAPSLVVIVTLEHDRADVVAVGNRAETIRLHCWIEADSLRRAWLLASFALRDGIRGEPVEDDEEADA